MYKIGIVGPQDTVEEVLDMGKRYYPNIVFLSLIYHHHDEIVSLIDKNTPNLNGLLFTGMTPYQIAKRKIDFALPLEYIPREVTLLYKILFELVYHQESRSIRNLSIDTFNEAEIQEFITEIPLKIENIYVLEDSSDNEQVIEFHENLYKNNKVDLCLTANLDPYLILQKKSIPIKRILPTSFSIKQSLELLLLKMKSHSSQFAQISIGIINIDNFRKVTRERPSEYHIQKIKLAVYELLLDYCQDTDSTLVHTGSDEFLIFTTIGSLKQFGENYDGTLVKLIKEKLQITVSYGLGLGFTASEAMHNARRALEQAKLDNGDCAYLCHVDNTIEGPLEYYGDQQNKALNPRVVHELSQEINIVPATLTKILDTLLSMDKTTFDASEFSQSYGCTLRTAHRILSTLTKENLVEVLTHSQLYTKGRPRRLYKFNPEKLQNFY